MEYFPKCPVCNKFTFIINLDYAKCIDCDVQFKCNEKPITKEKCSNEKCDSTDFITTRTKVICVKCGSICKEIEKEQKPDIHCKRCDTDKYIITDDKEGNILCSNCGVVINNYMISDEKEWNNYEAGVDKSRVGALDEFNPYSSCGSIISRNNRNRFIKSVNKEGKVCFRDLSILQISTTYTSKQKSYNSVASELDSFHQFPQKVINFAKTLWGSILSNKEYKTRRGSVRNGIIASCIIYACYKENCPMTRKEISKKTKISVKDITSGEHIFIDMISKTKYKYVIYESTDIRNMFEMNLCYFESDDKKRFEHVKRCKAIYNKYEYKLDYMKPATIVAGIIAYVLKNIPKSKVCNKLNVSVPTLNKVIKILKSNET